MANTCWAGAEAPDGTGSEGRKWLTIRDKVNAAEPVAVRTDVSVTGPSPLANTLTVLGVRGPPAGSLSHEGLPQGLGAEPGRAPSPPLSKTWAVTVLLFMSPPLPNEWPLRGPAWVCCLVTLVTHH